jgi:2-polyprenyl-3-methyl-5-hydroxy-6-metoxy-1,4-benzoquinol methylase
MTRICPACGSSDWEPFLKSDSGRILTSDQRIESGYLSKVICGPCGVVANQRPLTDHELRVLYGEAYKLNTCGHEEHLFFTANGPVPRSQVIFEWLLPFLPSNAQTVLEVGCGEGNVLTRFTGLGRQLRVIGYEGSRVASELARSKGLDIYNELILSGDQSLPQSDFVFSYGVLEHVEDIDTFVSVLKSACSPGGRVVFGLPVQDEQGYDVFFAEHVWHFTTGHVKQLLERRGLRVEHLESHHPVNRNAGLFVCAVAHRDETPKNRGSGKTWRAMQIANRGYWLGLFEKSDILLGNTRGRIAVYGSGEVLSLLMCHTTLGERNIVACIDENPNKWGTRKHGIPVHDPRYLETHPVDAVLLTVNSRYNKQIRDKLAGLKLRILSCFD